jgi:DNA-binding NtrC family response regulator
VLQDFRFARLGGVRSIEVNARVIASTNRDLEDAIASGEFRSDLYHRLNVVEIRVPPLRERRAEIPTLASWFLIKFNEEYGRQREIRPETMAWLTHHPWPGNVRELENVIRRLVLLPEDPPSVPGCREAERRDPTNAASSPGTPDPSASPSPVGLREIARRAAHDAEARALADALERARGNRAAAARALRVSYKTLLNKLTRHRLTRHWAR